MLGDPDAPFGAGRGRGKNRGGGERGGQQGRERTSAEKRCACHDDPMNSVETANLGALARTGQRSKSATLIGCGNNDAHM
ncbi:hypothetical protein WS69_24325 [Burkholderia sp. BDU5]|nr:hypothetical protein WS69_24325 [Burkholderia sp. BDU5]